MVFVLLGLTAMTYMMGNMLATIKSLQNENNILRAELAEIKRINYGK